MEWSNPQLKENKTGFNKATEKNIRDLNSIKSYLIGEFY